jgi:hypothetical protein
VAKEGELITRNKLACDYVFTITKFARVSYNGKEKRLVRIKNPWRYDVEWNGSWNVKYSIN